MKTEMTAVQTAAVAGVIKDAAAKVAKGALTVGVHPVSFTVKVEGTITKGEDYEQQIVAKANPWLLLAAALSHLNGVTVASIVKEALTADEALVEGLKTSAAEAIAELKNPTLTTCSGKVTPKLTVELV